MPAAAIIVVRAPAAAVQKGRNGRDEEQDSEDDSESKRGLEHGAPLLCAQIDVEAIVGGEAKVKVGAVGGGDAAQLVDGGYEGAEEANVDEGDEAGVIGGAVVGEEGEEGPGEGEGGHDEEEEDGGWGERVGGLVAVDEPCEHTNSGDLHYHHHHLLLVIVVGATGRTGWEEGRIVLTSIKISPMRLLMKKTAKKNMLGSCWCARTRLGNPF